MNDSDDSSDETPTEEGSGTRRKRGDTEDSSGASGDEIEDNDEVEPSNASATKFAIKQEEGREGNRGGGQCCGVHGNESCKVCQKHSVQNGKVYIG